MELVLHLVFIFFSSWEFGRLLPFVFFSVDTPNIPTADSINPTNRDVVSTFT